MGELPLADDVLYIGHSLVGTEIPVMLEEAVDAAGGSGTVRFQIINGAPLVWNWENSATAQGVDARAVLPRGDIEAVVMTEALPLVNHTTWSDTGGNALRFYQLATDANPAARVYLYETWHSLDSGSGIDVPHDDLDHVPWRQRLDDDLARWQEIVAHVNARRARDAQPMRLIPTGQAMARLHDEIAANRVPGIGDIREFFSDDIHPNRLGAYFVAMVHYAAIYGRDPRGLPRAFPDPYGGTLVAVPPALAARLQEIAWAVARPFLDAAGVAPAGGGGAAGLAFGLTGIADWSSQQPFIDVMKSARPWIGHLPGEWGGWGHEELEAAGVLDEDGWPVRIPEDLSAIATIVLADQPEEATSLAGRYHLSYAGEGTLRLDGRARVVAERPGEIVFEYAPGEGHVVVSILETDPSGRGDYVRDIAIVREDLRPLHAEGERFNPDWIARIEGARLVRFMDWMDTNDSEQERWQDRPRPGDYTYADRGVPVEVMVELANRIAAEPWFTMPHRADDDYMRAFATHVRDAVRPGLRVHVEYSNEVWNHQFEQAHYARAQAEARWGADAPGDAWMQYSGGRAAEMAMLWDEVFGADADDRLVKVVGTQTGWLGLEAPLLEAPLWTQEQGGGMPPAVHFDAYAVTGYFGGALGSDKAEQVLAWIETSRRAAEDAATAEGLGGDEAARFVERHRFDAARDLAAAELRDGSVTGDPQGSLAQLVCETLPYHASVAAAHGLELVMYEGGSHVVGVGPWVDSQPLTEFFIELSYSPEMGALYRQLLDGWSGLAASPFNAFTDVAPPSKWGSWGALRHLDDDNPRWAALMAEAQPAAPCPAAQRAEAPEASSRLGCAVRALWRRVAASDERSVC